MANEMRSLSDVEIDAVAGGYYLEDVVISSVVSPSPNRSQIVVTKTTDASSPAFVK